MVVPSLISSGEARRNRGCLHKGFRRCGIRLAIVSLGAAPCFELGLEDRLRRPPDRARIRVEVAKALPPFQGVLLNLTDSLPDDRVRRRVARPDDLVGGKELVVDGRPLQSRRAMGPFDEVDQILFARIDPGIPDDPQEPDDPPERREEFVFACDPTDAAPALKGRRKGVFVGAGEFSSGDLRQPRRELELPREGDSLRDAHECRADEAQQIRRSGELVRRVRAVHAVAVLLVDKKVQEFSRTRPRRASLVRRREKDFPRVVRQGVEAVRRARRRRVCQVRRRLDDFGRVGRVDGDDVSVGDWRRGLADLVEEGKDLVRTEASFFLERFGRRLRGRLAVEFVRDSLDQSFEVRQLPPHHPKSGGLDLARLLRVVPKISESARVGPGSTEAASYALEQRVRLVERSLGREARQVECLRVSSVRDDERFDRASCVPVAELAFHDLQDFIEAVACELDERPHPRGGRSMRPLSARVDGFPAIRGQGAHVTRLHALFDHVPEEGFEQCLRETRRLSEFEARSERGEQLPFDGARRRLLDPRNLGQEAVDPPLGRDEQTPRAFVQAEDERLVRPEFLPDLEHRALGLGPRRHHSAAMIADGQLRMCPMSKWSRRRCPPIAPDQCPSALVSGATARTSDASAGTIGSPTRISPPTRIWARRPPRWIRPASTPRLVSPSRWEHGSHSRMPRSRTSPTRNSWPTRWFRGTPRVTTFRRASPGEIASSLSRAIPAIASGSINVISRAGPGRSEYVPVASKYRSPSRPFPGIARTLLVDRIESSAFGAIWIETTSPCHGVAARAMSPPRGV